MWGSESDEDVDSKAVRVKRPGLSQSVCIEYVVLGMHAQPCAQVWDSQSLSKRPQIFVPLVCSSVS